MKDKFIVRVDTQRGYVAKFDGGFGDDATLRACLSHCGIEAEVKPFKKPDSAIAKAERAIVDAADKYRSADASAMADLLAAKWTLIDAVDAWRKLKGK